MISGNEIDGIVESRYDLFFFFKQKTAYEIGTGDWSSDVCSSDLVFRVLTFSTGTCPVKIAIFSLKTFGLRF